MMCAHDLEGIVAKRLADPYEPRVRWLKIKNSDYSRPAAPLDAAHRMRSARTSVVRRGRRNSGLGHRFLAFILTDPGTMPTAACSVQP